MSKEVVKSTARKLKYYMEIKRLEDGFDLSGPELPRQHYPAKKPVSERRKAKSTLRYDGLHDRSLKHYFHDPKVKQKLNHLNARDCEIDSEREFYIREQIKRHMRNSTFTHPYLPEGVYVYDPATESKPVGRPKKNAKTWYGSSSRPYSAGSRSYSAGPSRRKKSSSLRGGNVQLRSRPPGYVSKGEAERIINTATKLLAATEAVTGTKGRGKKKQAPHGRPYDSYYGIQHDDDEESLPYIDSHPDDHYHRHGYHSDDTSTRASSSQVAVRPRPRTTGGYIRRPNRPRTAKGARPRPTRPSSAKFAYDLSGRKYRISRVDESSGPYTNGRSDSETDRSSDRVPHRPNGIKVIVPKGNTKHLPEWLALQRAKARDQKPPKPERRTQSSHRRERSPVERNGDHRRERSPVERGGDFVSTDMSTQTDVTQQTQTISYAGAKSVQTVTHASTGIQLVDSSAQATVNTKPIYAQTTEMPGIAIQADISKPADPDPDNELEKLKHGPKLKSGKRTIYEIQVMTGNRLGASTKADIYLTIYGIKGNTGKIKLKQSKLGNKIKFQKGQTDLFKVDTYHVGRLECIEIGHDRIELGMGWYLDKVIIKEAEGTVNEFLCNRWLSAKDDNGRTIRVLPLSNVTYESSSESESEDDTQTEPESLVEKSEASTHYSQPSLDGNVSDTTETQEVSESEDEKKYDSKTSHTSVSRGRSGSESESDSATDTDTATDTDSESDSDSEGSVKVVRVRRGDPAPQLSSASSRTNSLASESSSSDSDTVTETETETEIEFRSKPKSYSGNEEAPSRESAKPLGVRGDQKKEAKHNDGSSSDQSRRSSEHRPGTALPTINEKDRESKASLSSSTYSSSSSSSSSSESESDDESVKEREKMTTNDDSKKQKESTKNRYSSDSESHTDSDSDSVTSSSSSYSSGSETEDDRRRKEDDKSKDIPPRPSSPTPPPSTTTVTSDEDKKTSEAYMEGFKLGIKASEDSETTLKATPSTSQNEEESHQHRGKSIHEATKAGDLDRVKELVGKDKSCINKTDEHGKTPLHIAAEINQLEILKWLSVNESDLTKETNTGYTAMHLAALNGHVKCVMSLSAMGASIYKSTVDKQTPMHLAAMSGNLECCKWLVANRASLNVKDIMERTPLDLAEQYNHEEVVKFLKSCQDELEKKDSSISQLRSPTKSDKPQETTQVGFSDLMNAKLSSSGSSWQDDQNARQARGRGNMRQRSDSGSSSSSYTSSSSSDSSHYHRRSRRRSSSSTQSGSSSGSITRSESETDVKKVLPEKMKEREDMALKERQKSFTEHHKKMEESGASFLDAIRAEYDDNEQKQ